LKTAVGNRTPRDIGIQSADFQTHISSIYSPIFMPSGALCELLHHCIGPGSQTLRYFEVHPGGVVMHSLFIILLTVLLA